MISLGMKRMALSWMTIAAAVASSLRIFVLVRAAAASASAERPACTDDADCSLNGVCDEEAAAGGGGGTGTCRCDAPWIGRHCEMLDFLPAVRTPCGVGCAFHGRGGPGPTAGHTATSSWGGSVLRRSGGDGVGRKPRFLMAVAEFANGCKLDTWRTNSVVSLAASDSPYGPFEWNHTAIGVWAHNPQMIYDPADDLYLIFSLGDGVPIHGRPLNCSSPRWPSSRLLDSERKKSVHGGGGSGGRAGIGITKDDSIRTKSYAEGTTNRTVHFTIRYSHDPTSGIWNVHNASIVDFPAEYDFPGNWNPAPLLSMKKDDGRSGRSVRIMVHTNTPTTWSGEVIVAAETWRGPYRPITRDVTSSCRRCQEDPFIWTDRRGNYHALYHRMFDPDPEVALGAWSGGHAFSSDGGTTWSNISRCYNTTVRLGDDGEELVEFYRRERPKLLFREDGVTPWYLYNGVQLSRDDDVTYTLAVPLNVDGANDRHRAEHGGDRSVNNLNTEVK